MTYKINILLFWFSDDWGKYGRTYERVAVQLAKLPEVGHVVCMFPPVSAKRHRIQGPLHIRPDAHGLTLLTETDFNKIRPGRLFTRLRERFNQVYRDLALKAYLRQLGFKPDNTVFGYSHRILTLSIS